MLECWNAGIMECWNAGIMECWDNGMLECWDNGMLILKGSFPFISSSLKKGFANKPLSHFPGIHYSNSPIAERSGGTLAV
jgi:hypothetical protein